MTNLIKENTYGKHTVKLELVFTGYNELYRASIIEDLSGCPIARKGYTSADLKKANARYNAFCREFK